MKDRDKKRESETGTYYMPICMCLGMSLGTAIGVATNNMAMCMCLGVSIGLCIGSMIDTTNRKNTKDASQNDNEETE